MDAGGTARLFGELTFESVPELHRQQESRFNASGTVSTVDLSGVDSVDSAGLALLLEWQACCGGQERKLNFLNAPDSLLSLARLCEADKVLDLGGPGEAE
jgi:phospholipid transport system transporter-binding protein